MPEVGDNLGRYTLLSRLASGGMGEVYVAAKAGPVGFGPYVALKVLREELAVDRQFVEMLVDEANISMFLNHQNVVSVLDLSEDDGRYYIAMEYVQGITVERLVETIASDGGKVPIPAALYIATELCRALKYAHTRVNHAGEPLNIIHRDVTPANILLSTQGEVKLTDFGIARARGRVHQTQAGVLKGKFGYMAPEMVRYERIDARADLFCAGVVVYLMLAGQHPVHGAAVMEAIQRFEDKQVPPPSHFNREVTPALDTIVMRSLEPKPDLRWSSAAALGDALQDAVLSTPAWRTDTKKGAQLIAQLMQKVTPDAFREPVPRDELQRLLEAQRGASSFTPQPRIASDDSTATSDPANGVSRSSGPVTARDNIADVAPNASLADTADQLQPVHVGSGASPNLVDLPTHEALPKIDDSQEWGPTPADRDVETDEELSLARVQSALSRADTDAPEALSTGDLVIASSPTMSYEAVSRPDSLEQAVDVAFPESSTDRNRVRDHMMAEPSLPATSEESPADSDADGATVVGVSLDEIEPDDDDFADPTMAMPPVHDDRIDDGRTVAGMAVPDWDPAAPTAGAPSAFDATVSDDDDENAATIIPMDGQAPNDEIAALLASEWGAGGDSTDLQDATLLDGVQAEDVQAALRAQQQGGGATIIRDESNVEEPVIDSTIAMHAVADDEESFEPTAVKAPGPALFDGPIRIPVTDDQPALAEAKNAAEALAKNAALIDSSSGELPTVMPSGPRPPASPQPPAASQSGPVNNDVGAATGRWMAGELDANALEWDDDAAARRAVATRNAGQHSPPRGTPATPSHPGYASNPNVAPPSSYPPSASASFPPGTPAHARPSSPYGMPAPQPPAGFLARNGLTVGLVAVAVLLLGGLGYAWALTDMFWPKLKLDSSPTGAQVMVDEVERGVTPIEVKLSPGERHPIRFSKAGYRNLEHEITEVIARGRTYTLRVDLQRVHPKLIVPVDATVYVNGRESGSGTEIELDALPESGPVTVRVVAPGHEPYEVEFPDATAIPESLDIPLTKKK
ncbi:MAG: serine/threonine-protein kinase [Deltaproteobacteria bacterium]